MPISGGSADKIGNRFELWWTALCLVDLLDERAEQIIIEPPGDLGSGLEFILVRNGTREYHQVKRQVSRGSGWTISLLSSNGVLGQMAAKLSDHGQTFHFVSTVGTRAVDEFAQNSRQVDDFNVFRSTFLTSGQRKDDWSDLCGAWKPLDDQHCYRLLKRLHVDTISEDLLHKTVTARLNSLVEGDSRSAANELVIYALDSVNSSVTPDALWKYLHSQDIPPAFVG